MNAKANPQKESRLKGEEFTMAQWRILGGGVGGRGEREINLHWSTYPELLIDSGHFVSVKVFPSNLRVQPMWVGVWREVEREKGENWGYFVFLV